MNTGFTNPAPCCGYCGNYHAGRCPEIKAIEYFPNGTVKRIEYVDGRDADVPVMIIDATANQG